MTYDPLDTNETDTDADGALTIDDLTATTVAGLDTSSGSGNAQIFTDGEGGLFAPGYVSELPVAYQNLVAWYPFDSARYGGSNGDDVTAIIEGSGDDNAYDKTAQNGGTFTSGFATDINAGANSGAVENSADRRGNSTAPIEFDHAGLDFIGNTAYTFCCWFKQDSDTSGVLVTKNKDNNNQTEPLKIILNDANRGDITPAYGTSGFDDASSSFAKASHDTTQPTHVAITHDGTDFRELYVDGVLEATDTTTSGDMSNSAPISLFVRYDNGGDIKATMEGQIDDVRIYNTVLSSSQISDIYDNTD